MKDFDNEEKLGELNKNIDEFIMKAEDVVNSWFFEFADLKEFVEDDITFTDLFLTPINVLLSGILSIIDYKKLDPKNTKKIHELQEYIQIIYVGIKGSVHHQTISILKNSMFYLENHEEKLKENIKSDFKLLHKFNLKLIEKMYESYPYNPDGDLKEINDYLTGMKNKDYDYKTFRKQLENLYKNLPDDKKILLKDNYEFSEDLIKSFAFILHIGELSSNFNHVKKQYKVLKDTVEKIEQEEAQESKKLLKSKPEMLEVS
jgi:hypothetical protein